MQSATSNTPKRSWLSGDILLQPFLWVLSLLDYVLTPIQKWIGYKRMAYFFVLPNLLIFGIFILVPMLLNFYYGFTSGSSVLLENRPFVGTTNFEKIFTCQDFFKPNTCSEDLFWRGAWNTLTFVVFQVVFIILMLSVLNRVRCVGGREFLSIRR